MDEQKRKNFDNLRPSQKVLYLLRSQESFGGPQSSRQMNEFLGLKKKNLDSVLSNLVKTYQIERISLGVYRVRGDKREPEN